MIRFLLRRLFAGLTLIVTVAIAAFILIYNDGTTIARNILGEQATQAQVEQRAEELGLNRPLPIQLLEWFTSALSGDLGVSWFTNADVTTVLVARLPVTVLIVLGAVIVTAVLAVALGLAAAARGGRVDRAVQVLSVAGFAIPNYWLALMLVLWLAIGLGLFPATGYTPPTESLTGWLAGLVLPVTAIALGSVASTTQQVRGAVLDILRQDYIRTLRSRGIPVRVLFFQHALKNAAPAGLTVLSLQFIGLLGGAVVIERVFALPGIGSLAVNSTVQGDVPMVMGIIVVTAAMVVIVNLVLDLAMAWVNPNVRIR